MLIIGLARKATPVQAPPPDLPSLRGRADRFGETMALPGQARSAVNGQMTSIAVCNDVCVCTPIVTQFDTHLPRRSRAFFIQADAMATSRVWRTRKVGAGGLPRAAARQLRTRFTGQLHNRRRGCPLAANSYRATLAGVRAVRSRCPTGNGSALDYG